MSVSSLSTVRYPTLVDAIWPAGASSRLLRNIVLAVVGSVLLWISAKVQVPMWPVPMTMQTFAVLVVGMAFGWRLGGATVLLYLAEGAVGLPVFAGGGGFAYLAGPTGGYLVGFLVAATVTGALADRDWDRSIAWTAAAMTIGTVIIFVLGLAWLSTLIGFDKAITAGLTPFIAGAVVKIALAALVLPMAWKLVERFRA